VLAEIRVLVKTAMMEMICACQDGKAKGSEVSHSKEMCIMPLVMAAIQIATFL